MLDPTPPRLRRLDNQWVEYEGQPVLQLYDRLLISKQVVLLPQAMALVANLMDGQRDAAGLCAAAKLRSGLDIPLDNVRQMLEVLDNALMLDNVRYRLALQQAVAEYRAAPFRTPAFVGAVYPGDSEELRVTLDRYVEDGRRYGDLDPVASARGVVSPHIDYQRGGPLYGATWSRVAESAREADLVVIFGTDHYGSAGALTLTRQSYLTPLGPLPTDQDVVGALATAIEPAAAFAEELHHQGEHSIELAAVWLSYVRNGEPVPTVPILCGSFHLFTEGFGTPDTDQTFGRALEALRDTTAGRKVLYVSAADLAHVGPQFGDSRPWGMLERATLHADDQLLVEQIARGSAIDLFRTLRDEHDRRRICGLPPTYLLLTALGETSGELVGYEQCPADEQQASWVSIAGLVMR